jgi:hypothetical protein
MREKDYSEEKQKTSTDSGMREGNDIVGTEVDSGASVGKVLWRK